MHRDRVIQLVCVLVSVLALAGAALLSPRIASQRQTLQLAVANAAADAKAPPGVTVTNISLGPMRGIWLSMLWHRANKYKEEGKYYDAYALADFITTLQPNFPQVWAFHAWNMAYNISVTTYTPEERWEWVNRGINLLREKGIPLNPKAVRLYRELAWTFFHKVGQSSDDMHWYYKRQLAQEWQEVLDTMTEGVSTDEAVRRFRTVAQAPDTLAELRRIDPDVDHLLARLAELGYRPDETLLRQIGRVIMFGYSPSARALRLTPRPVPGRYDDRLAELVRSLALPTERVTGSSGPGASLRTFQLLLNHLRKRVIIDRYQMDPAFMLEMMELYGPIDWRHPAAHAAYWGERGAVVAGEVRNKLDLDILNTGRMSIHAMQSLTGSGRVVYDPVAGVVDLLPDPRFIPSYEAAWRQARDRVKSGEYGTGSADAYDAGYENFLLRAVTYSYLYGSADEARRYWNEAARLFADKPHNLASGRYTRGRSLDQIVTDELTSDWDIMDNARQFIDAMLQQGFRQGLSIGDPNAYERFLSVARTIHARYNQKAVATPNAPQNRQALLPFEQIVEQTFLRYIQTDYIDLLSRVTLWHNAPLDLRLKTYDRLKEQLALQAQAAGFDPELAFPQPEGIDDYRKNRPTPDPADRPAAPVQTGRQ